MNTLTDGRWTMSNFELQGEDGMTLGERLRRRRKETGLTQEQLGEKSGTTQAVIQKIENGKSLRPRKLNEIAFALDVDPAWLMFGIESSEHLDTDIQEIAMVWGRLDPSRRSALKEQILREASSSNVA
jgi:transcriptional regulator with XRE-family HTH domain